MWCYLKLPGASLVPGEAVTDAAHEAGLPSHRAEAEPAVREAAGFVSRHHSVRAGADELDLHLQLEARHSVRGGAGLSKGSSPEDEEEVRSTGDDLRHGAPPAQSDQRYGRLRAGHSRAVIGREVVTNSLALRAQAQAGVRLPVLLHPRALHPHTAGLALRDRDHRLNNRDFQLVSRR